MKAGTREPTATVKQIDDTPSKAETVSTDEVALIAKRHRISPAIVYEIIRRSGANDRASIEREITKGKARR